QHHLDARKVRAVQIAASPLTLGMDVLAAPYVKGPDSAATTLNFTVAYNVAAAIVDRELSPRQFTRDRIKDATVWELARKVQLTPDDTYTRKMQERSPVRVVKEDDKERYVLELQGAEISGYKASFGARVRIEMEDGRTFDMEQEVPFGAAGRPFE